MNDMFDWIRNGANMDMQMHIVKRSVFYEVNDSIDRIAKDVINRLNWFHADHFHSPEFSQEDEEEAIIHDGNENAQLEGINQPEVMALMADILTQMTNMQIEIQRLNEELIQLRSTATHVVPSNVAQVEEEEE